MTVNGLRKNKIKVMDLIANLLIALQFDLFYLISTEFKLGQGILLVASAFIIVKYIKLTGKIIEINNIIIAYLLVLLFTGAYQVTRIFGGSVVTAFLAERVFWVYIIFYIALKKLYYSRTINNERCIKLLKYAGVIQLCLYFVQWILSNHVIFLHVLHGSRYGSARFYFQPILLILLLCFCVSDFLNKKKSIIWIVLILAEILIVQKYRMTTLAIINAIFCSLLLYKGNFNKRITIIIVGIIAFVILINTQIVQDIIQSILNKGIDNSVKGRAAWQLWALLYQLRARPLLGNGFVYSAESYNYGAQYVALRYGWSFTPGDYGLIGFVYEYGLLGAGWFLLFLVSQLKRAFYVWKYGNNYAYIIFLFFIIVDSYSELYWIRSNGLFALVIYMVMLQYKYTEILNNRNIEIHRGETVRKLIPQKLSENIERQRSSL